MPCLLRKTVSCALSLLMFWLYGAGRLDAESWEQQFHVQGAASRGFDHSRSFNGLGVSLPRVDGFAASLQSLSPVVNSLQTRVSRTSLHTAAGNPDTSYWTPTFARGAKPSKLALERPRTANREFNRGVHLPDRPNTERFDSGTSVNTVAALIGPISRLDASDLTLHEAVTNVVGDLSLSGTNSLSAVSGLTINAMTASSVPVGIFTAFGPTDYTRGTGAPVTVTNTFSVLNPATQYTLKAFNGGLQNDQTELVSSSVVTLNGVQVLGPNNFNQNVTEVDVPVTLQSSNTLAVQVRGKPSGVLTIQVVGVDNDPPSITATANPQADSFGWNNSNVVVTFTCSDKTSGIASCPTPATVSSEGAGQVVNGTATDVAGNTSSTSVTISLDKTSPTISPTQTPMANAFGWNNTPVTVNFNCADVLSGVASCTPPVTLTTEGANQGVSGTAVDKAGNSASASASINIDKTPPLINISSPANNAVVSTSTVTMSGTATDSLSGTAALTCNGSPATLQGNSFTCPISLSVGSNVISVGATDNAGNPSSSTVSVTYQPTPTGPFIASITPPGARFGDLITINGGGFGIDRTQVKVRFSYDYGTGVYTVDEPVIATANTSLTVAVPLAVPTKTNQVSVLVGSQTSPSVSYDVGALPSDPTPDIAGNEAFAFVADLDQLLSRIDARIDDWYVSTGTLAHTDTAQFHTVMTALRQALRTLQANAQNQDDQQTLHGLDILVSTQLMGVERNKILAAAATLSGSPIGSRLCESVDLVNVLNDIVDALDIVSEVLDVLLAAIVAACVVSVIISIITLGTLSELSGLICGVGASAIVEFLRDFNTILKTAVQVARAIINPAPNQPILGTYHVQISQFPEWGVAKPDFIYVDGADPVLVTAFNDFDNPQCKPDGCPIDLTFPIPVLEPPQSITITIHVPYKVATALGVDANLQFLAGLNNQIGFTGSGPDFNGVSRFTGADVNGPGLERGTYSVTTSSTCDGKLLGSQTDAYRLIAGPVFTSVTPNSAQLGGGFTVCGDPTTIPPSGAAASAVDFGDVRAAISSVSTPGCFPATVPDTALLSGPLRLVVNGRTADQIQPFSVLPPTLNLPSPDEVFATEPVVITGTGFAAADSNNSLTAGGVPVNVTKRKGNTITFTMGNANGGPLQLTAVGDHVSNQVPFKQTLRWTPPINLSNPNRDATNPMIAVLPDGSAGVAWIDRAHDGGVANLLFTDVRPGDSSFRSPITVTSDLAGLASSPQEPGLAMSPDGHVYITWVDTRNEIRMASFAFGTTPTGDTLVTSAPAGYAFKESAIGVAPNGTIHVSATEAPLNGDFNYVLSQATSQDGGATFGPLTQFEGPAPYLGEVHISSANGLLWRTYTKETASKPSVQISILAQSSTDGQSWSVPNAMTLASGIDQHPSISGDATGAVVAWDSTTFEESRVAVINGAAITSFFPITGPPGSDGKRPSVTLDFTGITSAAWINRGAGQSLDGVNGVPRLYFNRYRSRNFNQAAGPNQIPSGIDDSITIDSRPVVAVDGNRRLHMVWLAGPEGNRVLRYINDARNVYSDTNAPDLPAVASPSRSLIAVSTELGSSYFGTLLIDTDRPAEINWVSPGLFPPQDPWPSHTGPAFRANGFSLLVDNGLNEPGSQLNNLGDESTPFLTTPVLPPPLPPLGGVGFGGEFANWAPDGSVFALVPVRPAANTISIPKLFHSSPSHPNVLAPLNTGLLTSRTTEENQEVSQDSLLVAYEREDQVTALSPISHVLRVTNLLTLLDAADFPDGYYPNWASTSDKLLFVHKDFDTNQNPTGYDLMEFSADGSSTTGLPQSFTVDREVQWPVYSPDGANIAYQIRSGQNWTIGLLSGASFPSMTGVDDTRPEWSPTGQSIVFIRTDPATHTSQVMRWDLGSPAVQTLTAISSGVVLGGAQMNCSSAFTPVNPLGQRPTFPCFRGHAVWGRVKQ